MGNMGYCRFRNTLPDLKDCMNHIDDDDLDIDENNARIRLIQMCCELSDGFKGMSDSDIESRYHIEDEEEED